jgi:hypothetical protein
MMTRSNWLLVTILTLVAGTVAVGVINAEVAAPGDEPPAAVAPEPAPVSTQVSAAEPAPVPAGTASVPAETASVPAETAAAPAETAAAPADDATAPTETVESEIAPGEQATGAGAPVVLPVPPPRSLQTLVDERRDLLRQRRNAMFDTYSGRGAYMPSWITAYDDAVERYRDARRLTYRQRRDYNMARHDSWMDAMCPWSKPQRDWSRQRSIRMQMEQLDRRAARDAWWHGEPAAIAGSAPW